VSNAEWPDLPLVPPRSYTADRPPGQPTLIVVHYTAGSEGPTSAEDGAAYDQRRDDGTSAHYYVDRNSVVQCLYTWNRAHTALWNGNQAGIHYELCGTRQSRAEWLDDASIATLCQAAAQMRRDMARHGIPAVRLSPAQVRAGQRGVCGHGDVTAAWPEDGGDHTDPGGEFPWDVLMDLLTEDEDDMPTTIGGEPADKYFERIERALWWPIPGIASEVAAVRAELRALSAAFGALAAGGTSIDTAAVLTAVREVGDLVRQDRQAELAAARAEVEQRTGEAGS